MHTEPRTYRHLGRLFVIPATFPDTEEGLREANAHMAQHAELGVIAIEQGQILLARNNDAGIPAARGLTQTEAIAGRDRLRSAGIRCQIKYQSGAWAVLIAGVDY